MIEKVARFNLIQSIEALNRPNWSEINTTMIKIASIDKMKADTDLGGFDLEAAVKDHPEHLFVKIFAIKKDEVNDNADSFSEAELKKAAHTFVGVPIFTNHQNDDIEKAKGKVVHAWYDDEKGGIFIVARIDKVAYPRIARGIEEGYINGTSMGAQVQYSVCSICHNKAHTADEYCTHIKTSKNKKLSQKTKCSFHESKCKPTDECCPICACKKGESKSLELKQAQVFEHNFGIKFIEDSLVVNPACHECTIDCVLNVPEVTTKLSKLHKALKRASVEVEERMLKAASVVEPTEVSVFTSPVMKVAGKVELEKLNEAMGLIEVVARSMLDQKQQVSLEYVSDIMDILSNAQDVVDELSEMGYGALPSPPTLTGYLQNIEAGGAAVSTQAAQQPQQPQQPQMQAPQGGSPSDMSGMATITTPQHKTSAIKKEEFVTAGTKLKDKIELLRLKLAAALAERDSAFKAITSQNNKESGVKMENGTEKLAAGHGQTEYSQQVITEKVLADNANKEGLLHARTEKSPDGTTQSDSQLGRSDAPNIVTTESPQTRKDNSPNFITEAQLESIKDGYHFVRSDEWPEVITEKQWEEVNRAIGSVLSEDQSNHTTQAQLQDLLSHHTWANNPPNFTTNKQLAEGGFGDQGSTGSLDRLNSDGVEKGASVKHEYNPKKLLTAATDALVATIVNYNKSPEEVVKAAQYLTRNPQATIKAAYLTLINGMPTKVAARAESVKRNAYFSKIASTDQKFIKAHDALTACMGDFCRGLKAEDFVEAVAYAASEKSIMAKVDEMVREKLASRNNEETEVPTFDKFASLRKAAEDMGRPADGLYKVIGNITEVGVDPENKLAFTLAAEKLAQANPEVGIKTAAISVKRYKTAGTFEVILKDYNMLTDVEKADAAKREKLASAPITERTAARQGVVKTAQMGGMPDMGGGAPGGAAGGMPPAGGAGAGAGATPPAPPMENMEAGGGADEGAGSTGDQEPTPPGTKCPVCASEDVDIVEGRGKCKNCTAEFNYEVNIKVTKWPGTLDKGEKEEGEEGDQGEGFEMPEGSADASAPAAAGAPAGAPPMGGAGAPPAGGAMPVAASRTRLSAKVMEKVAASKDRILKAAGNDAEMAKIAMSVEDGGLGVSIYSQQTIAANPEKYMIGQISPVTGSVNTMKLAGNAHICLDSGTPYMMETAITKDDIARPHLRWKWGVKVAGAECSSCTREKNAFIKALASVGTTEDEFHNMDIKDRGDLILQMQAAGKLNMVKTASRKVTALAEFKHAFAMPASKFPAASCREAVARRFGKEAAAISGPCEGQNLADCVCKTLKKAEVYADYLAIKVASVWSLPDAQEGCLTDFLRKGFDWKQAETCCQFMKTKYAQSHEHMLDDMGGDQSGDMGGDQSGDMNGGGGMGGDDTGGDDFDFDAPDGGGAQDGGAAGAQPGDPNDPAASAGGTDDTLGHGDMQPTTVTGPESSGAPMAEVTPGGNVHVNQEVLQALETLDQAIQGAKGGGGDMTAPAAPSGGADLSMDQATGLDNAATGVLDDAGMDQGGQQDGGAQEGGDVPVEQDDSTGGDTGVDVGGDEGGDPFDKGNKPAADPTSFGGDGSQGDDMEQKHAEALSFANSMKRGTIGKSGKIRMDLTGVIAAVNAARIRKAQAEGKELKVETFQDAVPFKTENGATMGNEPKYTHEDAKVESHESESLMGNEKKIETSKATVSTGDQRMGHEEAHLKPELGDKITGGAGGAGGDLAKDVVATVRDYHLHTSTTRDMTRKLAERLVRAQNEVKVDKHVPTSKTEGIQPYQNGKTHPNADAEKPFSAKNPEIPENGKGAFMGKEEESIIDVPKATSEFAPSVPSKDGDKVNEIRGTKVSGSGDTKSTQYKAAMLVAGRMLTEKVITANQLLQTVEDLKELSPNLLKAYEQRIFAAQPQPKIAAKRGLTQVQDGVEQPVVLHEVNQVKRASLSDRISKCFTLTKQMDISKDTSDADVRKKFNR